MLSSLATVLHLLSETIYGGQEVLAVAGIILMSYFHSSFFSFLFLLLFYVLNSSSSSSSFFFFFFLKFKACCPFTVITKYWLYSSCCTTHWWAYITASSLYLPLPTPIRSPPSTGSHCCSLYLGVCFLCCYMHKFVVFFNFHPIFWDSWGEGSELAVVPLPHFFFFPQWLSYTLSPCSDWKHLGSKKGLLH